MAESPPAKKPALLPVHLSWAGGLVLALLAGFGLGRGTAPRPAPRPPDAQYLQATKAAHNVARCIKVLDGDTVRVQWKGAEEDIRFLGIDCPETKHSNKLGEQAQRLHMKQEDLSRYGEIAKKTTSNWLLGRDLHIVFPSDQVNRDAFGRLLAYVEEQGVDIGERLLLGGNAMHATDFVHPRQETYKLFEAEARKNGKGVWRVRY